MLTLNTKPYAKSMKGAARNTRTFGQQLRKLSKTALKFGTVALGAAVFALQRMVRTQLEVIDATTKMARSLGFTTEQLIGLERAAGIAGVANKDLATALRRLSKNISDATIGLTTAIRAFDALGLSAQALIDLEPHEALLLVADAMSKMQNPVERTRVALDLFGRSGVKMIELMKNGAAGLRAMQQEAEAAGLTFSEFAGQQVEAANDAILRMKESFTALVRKMTIEYAPTIERTANTIRAMAPQLANVAVVTAKWTAVIIGLAAALKLAAVAAAILHAVSGPAGWIILAASAGIAALAVVKIKGAFDDAAIAAESFRSANASISAGAKTTIEQIAAVRKAIRMRTAAEKVHNQLIADGIKVGENAAQVFRLNWTRLHDLNDELLRLKGVLLTEKVDEFAAAIRAQTEAIGGNTFALQLEQLARDGASDAQIRMLEGLQRELELRKKLQTDVAFVDQLIERSLTPLERFIKSKERLVRALEAELITDEKYKRALKELTREFNEATTAGDALRKSLEEIGTASVAPEMDQRTGEFRQVDSIRRLALQGVRTRAQQRLEDVMKRFDTNTQESIEHIVFMLRDGLPIKWKRP